MRLGRGAVGASRVERLRREDRGAESAEKVGYREGVSPSHRAEGIDFRAQNGEFWCIL